MSLLPSGQTVGTLRQSTDKNEKVTFYDTAVLVAGRDPTSRNTVDTKQIHIMRRILTIKKIVAFNLMQVQQFIAIEKLMTLNILTLLLK